MILNYLNNVTAVKNNEVMMNVAFVEGIKDTLKKMRVLGAQLKKSRDESASSNKVNEEEIARLKERISEVTALYVSAQDNYKEPPHERSEIWKEVLSFVPEAERRNRMIPDALR
jgi:hypothetical protein